MRIEVLTVTVEREPLDLLLFRRFRRDVPGLVEDTLTRNPGLAGLGVILPLGTQVRVAPEVAIARARAAETVSLYD